MTANPTLEDVARATGVSTATVSRVLNEPAKVRPETRAKVEAAVEALGYTPHFGAKALASNRTFTFGAVIPTMENAIFAQGLQALQEALAESGVTLFVATSDYDPAREAAQIRALIGRGVDGLVLIGEARSQAVYDLIARRGTPLVLTWTWTADSRRHCVGFDNRAAARMMAERVFELGHKRVAMLGGLSAHNDRAAERIKGVREAGAAAGADVSVIETPYALDAAEAACRDALSASPRPTALICGNDVIAVGAMLGARAAGLSVPTDLSIVGFDDIDLSRLTDPPLTTVHLPHRRMGAAAASVLLNLRDAPDGPIERIRFEPTIVERGSLAPPPA